MIAHTTDIVALAVIGLSALWGAGRGFAREIFSLAAWIGALVLAVRVAPLMSPWLREKLNEAYAADVLSYLIAFVVLLLILTSVAQRFANALRGILVGGTDRLLGCLFGAGRGYILLVVLFIAGTSLMGQGFANYIIAGSHIGPYILQGVQFLDSLSTHFPQVNLALPRATGHDAVF